MENKEEIFEKIAELMPDGWEDASREMGALTRNRKIRNASEFLRLVLLYLTSGGSFGRTSAMLKSIGEISQHKNAVYERALKSGEWLRWLCENICRNEGHIVPNPEWSSEKRVCLIDGSDESKRGSHQADWRLYYCVERCG